MNEPGPLRRLQINKARPFWLSHFMNRWTTDSLWGKGACCHLLDGQYSYIFPWHLSQSLKNKKEGSRLFQLNLFMFLRTFSVSSAQVLYVPRHWWHYVESVDPITVSVNSWIELVSSTVMSLPHPELFFSRLEIIFRQNLRNICPWTAFSAPRWSPLLAMINEQTWQ